MRGSNLRKFLKALDLVGRPNGATFEELQKELDLTRRSVYREIEFLQDMGLPIYDDTSERPKRWKLSGEYLKKLPNLKIPNIEFTPSEIISLYFLKGENRVYKGTEIEKAINSAFTKIGLFAHDDLFMRFDKIKTILVSSSKFAKDYSDKEGIIDSLTKAMFLSKTCKIGYHSFSDDKTKDISIDPLNFFENNGGLYLFIRITGTKDIKIIAVERIEELKITDVDFTYPKGFKPEERLDNAFGIIYDVPIKARIWFSKEQARYIRQRKWAKQQKIVEHDNGSIILEMKTSGWLEVKRWILSFGKEAEVLEPSRLRDEVKKEIAELVNRYE